MIIGHIGARKGSKGVPNKNFRDMCGKPLIDWSLDQLLESSRIDAVVVSTDSQDIYDHAVAKGALAIGLRPAHLATDDAPKWGVWQHALEAAEALAGKATAFVDLDCTSPLRLMEDIDGAVDLFQAETPDMVMSCCHANKNPYFNMVELNDEGSLRVSKPLPGGVWARQNAPVVYEHAASTYVLAPEYLRKASTIYEGHVIPFVMPADRCMDVDDPLDWKIVEFLMKDRLNETA
ncbi:acylneuraminate cytidylyltransferase family protein [Octadecabacter sp. 1_MG-2023]|uniref:acylneuraminate cytidylyltransferase family protein n=1 Tax=unclassified Octadecabacter TaxID=196158 RepID=UPI001C09A24D|nr:acylneuraminate cytidylyltransferase family protein [Octadecabacter sp. 1_MG-2023]MBU2994674.1 acylneuraminate cytidylyltransferase family protein [Octadecabacter sp. B2R22]MDO6734032.1 acylneuraminate cytidylyltransferase family protein [Octadecabacter sp. 1_MG-2023]